jgi:hypothetical protein
MPTIDEHLNIYIYTEGKKRRRRRRKAGPESFNHGCQLQN